MDTKIKTMLEVKNETVESADLHLYGTIREKNAWDKDEETFISANKVVKAISGLKGKNINVHINSGGGDVFESIAICNMLKQHDGEVNIIIDGLAGSGASVIAMAGKTVKMFNNSMMMIHKAWTIALGNADDLIKVADDLEKMDTSVMATYKDRFVGTDEELSNLIKGESWLTAEECQAFGFADEIITEEKPDKEPKTEVKASLFEKYRVQKKPNLLQNLGGKNNDK